MSGKRWPQVCCRFFFAAVKRTAELSVPNCDFVGFRYAPDNLWLVLAVQGSGWKTTGAM